MLYWQLIDWSFWKLSGNFAIHVYEYCTKMFSNIMQITKYIVNFVQILYKFYKISGIYYLNIEQIFVDIVQIFLYREHVWTSYFKSLWCCFKLYCSWPTDSLTGGISRGACAPKKIESLHGFLCFACNYLTFQIRTHWTGLLINLINCVLKNKIYVKIKFFHSFWCQINHTLIPPFLLTPKIYGQVCFSVPVFIVCCIDATSKNLWCWVSE